VVAVGTVLSPEHLHLSDMETALALLVIWGMGAIMSPFSGTVLQVARMSNCSPFRVAWVWNARFSLVIGLPISAVVYAVARLL
jgi:C4-dicarboxylate transporter